MKCFSPSACLISTINSSLLEPPLIAVTQQSLTDVFPSSRCPTCPCSRFWDASCFPHAPFQGTGNEAGRVSPKPVSPPTAPSRESTWPLREWTPNEACALRGNLWSVQQSGTSYCSLFDCFPTSRASSRLPRCGRNCFLRMSSRRMTDDRFGIRNTLE